MAYVEHPSSWLSLGAFATLCTAVYISRLQTRIQPPSERLATIDGLRGILALSVFIYHFFVTYQWKHIDRWETLPTHTTALLGGSSVTLFFMITGFLFFGRLKATRGLLDFNAFFVGRLFRLLPVYLVVVTLVFAMNLVRTGSNWSTAFRPALDGWLLFQSAAIGGDPQAGVADAFAHWTLAYEWLFYLALPILGYCWKRLGCESWVLFIFTVVLVVVAYRNPTVPYLDMQSVMFAPFAIGGLVGEAGRSVIVRRSMNGPQGTLTCVLGCVGTVVFCDPAYSITLFLTMTMVFAPISMGNSLFGLLRTRTILMLGEISYDVYLLHGLVLFGLFTLLRPDALAHASTPGRLFSLLIIAGLCTLFAAVLAHVFVERPCLRLGRKLVMINRTQELAAP